MRYLGYKYVSDVDILSLHDYEAQMHAYRLREVDKDYDMHMQAWLNHKVTGMKEKGKKHVPVFDTFKDFYDVDKALAEVEGHVHSGVSDEQKRLARIAKRVNERG